MTQIPVPNGEVSIADGRSFLISDGTGDIQQGTRQGLYRNDIRFLSSLRLLIDGKPLVPLSSQQEGPGQARFYATNPEIAGAPAGVLGIQRRRRVNGRFSEVLFVRNHSTQSVTATLRIELDADYAHVLEVRAGSAGRPSSPLEPGPERWQHGFRGAGQTAAHRTLVRWSRAGSFTPRSAEFPLTLSPGSLWSCGMRLSAVAGEEPAGLESRRPARPWGPGSPAAPRQQLTGALLDQLEHQAATDLSSLRLELPCGETVVAAGMPNFMTLFGRDSLITAYATLPAWPELAASVLRALSGYQSLVEDPQADQEPGKIIHELRYPLGGTQRAPYRYYYGSVDATPLFLILFSEYLKRTGDAALGEDLWPAAEAALDWIDHYGDLDGDGFVEYNRRAEAGLDNQGWKDSWDAICFAGGELARPPIALCEVQGYVYDAKRRMAELYRSRGEHERAAVLERQAGRLQERFEEAFWLPAENTYALALDGDKQPVDSVASNAGHALWSGIASTERAALVAARLLQDDMYSGWGLRTLSTRMARYNPIAYHNGSVWPHDTVLVALGFQRYGLGKAANKLLVGVLEAAAAYPDGRLPELFAGYPRVPRGKPVPYPEACSPQAWGAAATLLAIRYLQL